MKYKMRAECVLDAQTAVQVIMPDSYSIEGSQSSFPDVEITFESSKMIRDIEKDLVKVADSHVMIETLQPIALYTGKRIKP